MQEKLPEWAERRAELLEEGGAAHRAYKQRLGPGGPCRATCGRSGARSWSGRVATRLAMPCDADSSQILSRSRAVASFVDECPSAAPLVGGPASRKYGSLPLCHSRCGPPVAAAQWTPSATTLSHAQKRACWPDVPEGQVVQQHWLAHTTAPGVAYSHRTTDAWTLSCILSDSAWWRTLLRCDLGVPSHIGRVTHSPACSLCMSEGAPSVAVQLAVASTALGRSDSAELSWRPGFEPRR